MGKRIRKVRRWIKRLFEPWQDFDRIKREVQEARKSAPAIGYQQREWTWRFVKKEDETKKSWLERMARHEIMFEREE